MNAKFLLALAGGVVASHANAGFTSGHSKTESVDLKADFAEAHALTRERDGLSQPLKQIIQKLKYDFSFLRSFYNDPKGTLAGYDLTNDERAALLANDVNHLIGLGIAKDEAIIVASGTHRGRRQA